MTATPSKSVAAVSLPLMGIENYRVRFQPLLARHLITPHGDRKPPVRVLQLRRARGDSLPLMGIENTKKDRPSDGAGHVIPSLPLMGIENIGSGLHDSAAARRLPTHYPSWGSKTDGHLRHPPIG